MTATREMPPSRFPTTQWGKIGELQGMSVDERRRSLGEFLELYQDAMHAYVLKFFGGLQEADAADLVQGFTTDRILSNDLIARVSADRGRLRRLLQKALHNYCLSTLGKTKSKLTFVPEAAEADRSEAADQSFEATWREIVFDEAIRRTVVQFKENGQYDRLTLLKEKILGPAWNYADAPESDEISRRIGTTPHRMRSRLQDVIHVLREKVREVVAEYVGNERVDDELAALMEFVASRTAQ